jgi:hypothetical protein
MDELQMLPEPSGQRISLDRRRHRALGALEDGFFAADHHFMNAALPGCPTPPARQ